MSHWIDSSVSLVDLEKKGCGSASIFCVSTSPQHFLFFPLLDAVVTGPKTIRAGFLSKKLTVFNLYVRIPKGPMGQDGLRPSLQAKLGLSVNAAILPGGKDSPLVLHACNLTLSD